jgi:hypothetical protein
MAPRRHAGSGPAGGGRWMCWALSPEVTVFAPSPWFPARITARSCCSFNFGHTGVPRRKINSARTSLAKASSSCCLGIVATALISSCENWRPRAATICATSHVAAGTIKPGRFLSGWFVSGKQGGDTARRRSHRFRRATPSPYSEGRDRRVRAPDFPGGEVCRRRPRGADYPMALAAEHAERGVRGHARP